MPLLAVWLGTLFGGLASWFAQWMTKKAAFALAAIATFSALTVALVAGMQALLAGVVLSFPETNQVVLSLLWVGIPDNATTCIAACIASDTAVALYRWNVQSLQLASYTS